MSKTESSMKNFDGSACSEVKKFFFIFYNVLMGGKSDDYNASDILSLLHGKVFNLYYTKFALNGGIIESASSNPVAKNSLIEEFYHPADPEDNIRRAANSTIDLSNLTGSLR